MGFRDWNNDGIDDRDHVKSVMSAIITDAVARAEQDSGNDIDLSFEEINYRPMSLVDINIPLLRGGMCLYLGKHATSEQKYEHRLVFVNRDDNNKDDLRQIILGQLRENLPRFSETKILLDYLPQE
ncbi:MAG: hypothetical protein V1725_05410 [archaeon]